MNFKNKSLKKKNEMHPHNPAHTFTLNAVILLLKNCLELAHNKSIMFQNATNNYFRTFTTQIDRNNKIKKIIILP